MPDPSRSGRKMLRLLPPLPISKQRAKEAKRSLWRRTPASVTGRFEQGEELPAAIGRTAWPCTGGQVARPRQAVCQSNRHFPERSMTRAIWAIWVSAELSQLVEKRLVRQREGRRSKHAACSPRETFSPLWLAVDR